MKFLAILTLSALTFAAHARIGDTEGQSQQRYGQPREDLTGAGDKPLMIGAVERAYEYKGFRIRAAFAEGKCVVIEYAKIPEDGVPKQLVEAEIAAILEAEKGQYRWKEEKIKAPPGVAEIAKGIQGALNLNKWERTDGAIAEKALGLVVKISAKDADRWEKRFQREAEAKAREDAKRGIKPAAPKKPTPEVPKF